MNPSEILWKLIVEKLGPDYILTERDAQWVNVVGMFWDMKESEESILEAVDEAEKAIHDFSIDPEELFIDAGLIDNSNPTQH